MKNHFLNLFQYDAWANGLILQSIEEKSIQNQKIELLFSHLLIAQKVWLNRCINKDEDFELWSMKQDLVDFLNQNTLDWLNYLESLENSSFENSINYQNTKGQEFNTLLKDILIHIVNHGTYHRGQIIQLLKEERITVPQTDYIFWVR